MKCFVLAVLSFAIALEAKPYGIGGLGGGIGSGLGSGVGTGLGLGVGLGLEGVEALGAGAIGAAELGTGLVSGIGHGLVNGLGNGLGLAGIGGGRQEFNSGASGRDREQFYDRGANGFHNRGQHTNRVTSIQTAENNENHDVGAQNHYANGADRGAGYDRYNRGMSGYQRGLL